MGLVLAGSQDGPHMFFTHYQEVVTKTDKWIHLCAPYISMFYDLCYEVRDTLSADLCQGQLFSKQFSNS